MKNYVVESYENYREEERLSTNNARRIEFLTTVRALDEWCATGEKIVPYAIRRLDYRDFENYCNNLEIKDDSSGLVPDSTFCCLDEERNIMVGAVNIRHYLNESLLLNGGHIGDGVRPSERRKGYATQMLAKAKDYLSASGFLEIYVSCLPENEASRRTILANGGEYIETVYLETDKVDLERYVIKLEKQMG